MVVNFEECDNREAVLHNNLRILRIFFGKSFTLIQIPRNRKTERAAGNFFFLFSLHQKKKCFVVSYA